jgi:CrcB protein
MFLRMQVGTYIATLLVEAINLGTLGCLSTVSTFVTEIQIMHEGSNRWRSYAYPMISMLLSLIIGIFIYGVPVWTKFVARSF